MSRVFSLYHLTHFLPLVSFDTPIKYQKTIGFLMFSGGIKKEPWRGMVYWAIVIKGRLNHLLLPGGQTHILPNNRLTRYFHTARYVFVFCGASQQSCVVSTSRCSSCQMQKSFIAFNKVFACYCIFIFKAVIVFQTSSCLWNSTYAPMQGNS